MTDGGARTAGPAIDTGRDAAPTQRDGLARGRSRFNQGDFWGSHEAFEQAWRTAPEAERRFLQGLIQAGAAFHKLVVQDNTVGTLRLLARSLAHLEGYSPDHQGVDVVGLRGQLAAWRQRVIDDRVGRGPLAGLPRIEWASTMAGRLMRVDEVGLYAVDSGSARAVLVAVSARGVTGWGECRHRWGEHGLWDSLVLGVAPALLAEAVATPGELAVTWPGLVGSRAAVAGVEAAMWDLWSRLEGLPLHEALGFRARDIPLACVLPSGDTTVLGDRLVAACSAGYELIVLPARPNADRRVIPALEAVCARPLVLDLGEAYRPADIEAIRVLDELRPRFLVDPVPRAALASARRLRRWLSSPIGLSGWLSADGVASALELGAMDAVIVDPGKSGLAEAREIAAVAHEAGAPLWVVSSAATYVGAAADLALAMHPAAEVPAAVSTALAAGGHPAIEPDALGRARPAEGPGFGPVPDQDWLAAATVRHANLHA